MFSLLKTRALTTAFLLTLAAPALAQDWQIDPGQSSLKFEAMQSGSAVVGTFETWEAAITFDPENLAASNIQVTVDMASARTGNATVDQTLLNADWFDTSKFTTATFRSSEVNDLGEGKFEAVGTLTMKDREHPLTLPFTLTLDGDSATVTGVTDVLRLDYDLGASQPEKAVAGKVAILIAVKAQKL